MALTKAKKKEVLEKLESIIKDSKSITFANYDKLTVAEVSEMRRTLKGAGVGYRVVKKTLARKAFEGKGITGDAPEMQGQIGFAYSLDLIAPAREIFQAGKKYENKVSIVGGVFDGKYMSKDEMTVIASIPSHKTLLGMFVNIINSPIQGFVIGLSEIAKQKLSSPSSS